MSHRPHLDRYQRLASQLPMRDPVAGPDQLRTLGPRALVGALQGGARYGEALLDASEEAWTEYLDYIANEHPAFYVGDERRIAKRRLSRDGYRRRPRGPRCMSSSSMRSLEWGRRSRYGQAGTVWR